MAGDMPAIFFGCRIWNDGCLLIIGSTAGVLCLQYLIGASIKDLGKKWFGFTHMENTDADEMLGRI
jgi:hypothetical protein